MYKHSKKLIAFVLVFVMALTLAVPAFAATYYESSDIENKKNVLYARTTETLSKVPTNLAPTPLPEDLHLDPLAYWKQIIPRPCYRDADVEKTTRPTHEIYQEILQLVDELTGGLTTDSDKFTALEMWVDDNITYSTENRTDNVYLVYERRYGACVEISNLLYFMATLAGVKAIILLGGNHQSTGALDENGVWFGDEHSYAKGNPVAETVIYAEGLNYYFCDLDDGEITKYRTIEGKEKPVEVVPLNFSDVPADAWFADAVNWAVAAGVTKGDGSANTFNPYGKCTQVQVITFLYRAKGEPDAGKSRPSFTIKNAWATDAINWAYSKGIINNYFQENAPCNRATAVYYMWVALKPTHHSSPQFSSVFTDMDGYSVYSHAVDWAIENGIVRGTSPTTFSPGATCNRATIVTLLYRAFVEPLPPQS